MRILVTGGAGFIGSNIVDGLINKGYKTFVIDNLSSGKSNFIHPEAEFFQLDIVGRDLDSIFKEVKPQCGHSSCSSNRCSKIHGSPVIRL